MRSSGLWGKYPVKPGEVLNISTSRFELWIRMETEGCLIQEIPVASGNELSAESQALELPDRRNSAYFHTGTFKELHVLPSLPDRPVIFRNSSMVVSPGRKLDFYIGIPLFVQIYSGNPDNEQPVREIPWNQFKHSWLGDPDVGEPAYAFHGNLEITHAYPDVSDLEAVCRISLQNDSSTSFVLNRVVVRVENLGLYRMENRILTSRISLDYRGSFLSAEYHPPAGAGGKVPELVQHPRVGVPRKILKTLFLHRD